MLTPQQLEIILNGYYIKGFEALPGFALCFGESINLTWLAGASVWRHAWRDGSHCLSAGQRFEKSTELKCGSSRPRRHQSPKSTI